MFRRPKARAFFAKIAVLTLSTLMGLGAIEVIVRVAGFDKPLMWEPDPYLGWRHIPNSSQHWVEEGDGWVEINSLGLRDPERSLTKDADVFRIAVFGDSTTEAVQVNLDQTFTQLVEQRLRARGLRVEVLNFGVNGYGPLQEYLLYSRHGKRFSPDLVLHAVFLDNDIADGHPRLTVSQSGAPFLRDPSTGVFDIDHSASAASYASYRTEPTYSVRRVSAAYRMVSAQRYNRIRESIFQEGLATSRQVPKRYLLYAQPPGADWLDAWRTFDRVIERFSSDVRADGGSYALLSMPAGQVVYADVWRALTTEFPAMSSRQWDLRAPEKRLAQMAAARGLQVIAPLDTFVENADGAPLFFGRVGHLTPRGHAVMAAALETALLQRGLLPQASSGADP